MNENNEGSWGGVLVSLFITVIVLTAMYIFLAMTADVPCMKELSLGSNTLPTAGELMDCHDKHNL